MSLQVTVALIADYDAPFGRAGVLDEHWYELPYRRRRHVALRVEQGHSLAETLERAAEALQLRPPADYWGGSKVNCRHRRVAFYKPQDDAGFAPRAQGRLDLGSLIIVDSRGHAIFGVQDLSTVRFTDLLRTAEAGALDGDPLRPYLIIDEGWGDAPPVDWAVFLQGLDVAWETVKTVGTAYGGFKALEAGSEWIRDRLAAGRDALKANPEWAQRGYRPDQFATLLEISDGQPEQLAQLLGCTAEQAQAIYWVIGYAYDENSQRWRAEADDAARVLRQLLEAVGYASHSYPDEWEPRLGQWLQRYLETGEAPPLNTLDPVSTQDFEDDLEIKPSPGERLDGFLSRWRRR